MLSTKFKCSLDHVKKFGKSFSLGLLIVGKVGRIASQATTPHYLFTGPPVAYGLEVCPR